MKHEDHNPTENLETRSYKKRYLVRKIQEAEAEKEIKAQVSEPANYRNTEPHLWEDMENELVGRKRQG